MNFIQLLDLTPEELVKRADESFIKNYRLMRGLFNGRVHNIFNKAISNFDFLKIVIFNNDYLKIPPVETFLVYYESELKDLSHEEKRCIGALYGNLFKFIFNYSTTERKQYKSFIVSSAAYFLI